jgi:hypothetical protein
MIPEYRIKRVDDTTVTFTVPKEQGRYFVPRLGTRSYFKLAVPYEGWRGWLNLLTNNWCYKPGYIRFDGKISSIEEQAGQTKITITDVAESHRKDK